ncbi:ribosome maturation factor RimM [Flavobacteriaceae bacterium]|jgi:16S rRNA processing protein RimM|nr:ribosome maturation factor RimM [Bacteroidota bacterium]MDB4134725.1 ribosome maturation factor RimM [Flavobacteriaceae bacterium]MDB4179724.1 ribosome maturation factor RimM [Flavobacteriaceae bacterium]MDC0622620.1 ribosome maturation factor RimM [Flavobacteriaceae bacterium]MDC1321399.1 ribosome maturation factor RimM [Flavobacteriaceae bacterium]|tara:strand:- start:364 stop:885 length:522 start_codon:yes stop_codon:yes gene_type:complete
MKDYYYLGKITKKYSFKGEVLLKIDTDQPSYYKKIKSLFIYKENKLTLHKIEVARFHKDSLLRLKFEGINSEKEANSIINCDIYLPINNLPILTGNKFYYHDVINYLIIDEDFGEIGKIISIKENISQDLFVIDHNKNEVLIPIHDEFIVEVDKKKNQIIVKTPEGLIDLYIN